MTEAPAAPQEPAIPSAPQIIYVKEVRRQKYTPNFYQWVTSQTKRTGRVGECGRAIKKIRMWYRSTWQLGLLLRAAQDCNIDPHLIKHAHAEWRQVRRRTAR
jgi:hypothetical protein